MPFRDDQHLVTKKTKIYAAFKKTGYSVDGRRFLKGTVIKFPYSYIIEFDGRTGEEGCWFEFPLLQ